MPKILFFLLAVLIIFPKFALANDFRYSIGGGFPYLLSAEVAYVTKAGKRRWYGNYKAIFDPGFALGMESSVSADNKHAVGVYLGAVGLKKGDGCGNEERDDLLTAVVCAGADVFDWETLHGLGATYSYSFNTLSRSGWKVGAGLGYGWSSNEIDGVTGQLGFSYQF